MSGHRVRAVCRRIAMPLVALGALLAFNALLTDGFFHVDFRDGRLFGIPIDVADRAVPVMLLALGMTLVIGTGGVDLSVGATMAIAGAVMARVVTAGYGPAAAITSAVAVGVVLGAGNGLLVSAVRIQPIVATLILMVAGRGVAQLLTNGQIITFENAVLNAIGNGAWAGLPWTMWIALAAFTMLALATRGTAAGLFIEAVGDNARASRLSGVPVGAVKLGAYTFSGFCAGIAGILTACDIQAADANNAGLYLELDAILAVVLGGTALTGGRFYLAGSIVGALIIQTLTTTILMRGIPVEYTLVVKALVVLGVCLATSDVARSRLRIGRAAA